MPAFPHPLFFTGTTMIVRDQAALIAENVVICDALFTPDFQHTLLETIAAVPLYCVNRGAQYGAHPLDVIWYCPFAYAEHDLLNENVEEQLLDLDETLQPLLECWNAIKSSESRTLRLYSCELSANSFGTEGNFHHDVSSPELRPSHGTALVFCNEEWKTEWAGETLVFNDEGEISSAVMPRPGRVAKIFGDPLHVGRSVSRICPVARRVLVYKFWVE